MTRLRLGWTLLGAVVVAAVGWAGTGLAAAYGLGAPVLLPTALVTVAVVAVLILVLGWRIRQDRDRPPAARMDPVAAARVLVAAQASGVAGTLIGGWHLGAALHLLPLAGLTAPAVRDGLILAGGCAVLVGVAFLVQHWCRIPPEGEDGDGTGHHNGGSTEREGRVDGPGSPRPGRPGTQGGYAREGDRPGRG